MRFFFDMSLGNDMVEDAEGSELSTAGQACSEAIQSIKDHIADRLRAGHGLSLDGRVDVFGSDRNLLFVVSFHHAAYTEAPVQYS